MTCKMQGLGVAENLYRVGKQDRKETTMKLFNKKSEKRMSLESFKKSAEGAAVTECIAKITGGALDGCHTGGLA
jgi:hypothetical protein